MNVVVMAKEAEADRPRKYASPAEREWPTYGYLGCT